MLSARHKGDKKLQSSFWLVENSVLNQKGDRKPTVLANATTKLGRPPRAEGQHGGKHAMTEGSRTQGEILFEQYLESQGLPFEFEKKHAGKSKRPDYTVEWKGHTVIFDVKDFQPQRSY
jgi:hypothetical protein